MSYSFKNLCRNTIPAGTYKAQVSEIKFKANDKSNYNLEVHYTITDGAYAKRTLIDTIFEGSFAFRLKPFLTACAIDLDREFDTADEMYRYAILNGKGKIVMLEIGVRTYNGNEYNEVKSWAPIPSSTTSFEEVAEEFEMSPDLMPKTPHIDDIAGATQMSIDDMPALDINDSDVF